MEVMILEISTDSKKILITGTKSFIGTSLERWLNKNSNRYTVDTIDLKNKSWRNVPLGKYDVVFHVAGIAHMKETKGNVNLYYKINRDLAIEVAKKAKFEGVKQFIFLSSMSVYGIEKGLIDENTIPSPVTHYGKSKLQAERIISELRSTNFKVAIIRPPMVYGIGCKGNYPKLANVAKMSPIFPRVHNNRSMIHIDNFCEFIRLVVDDNSEGLFFPQNEEYICTTEMVKLISKIYKRKIWFTKLFNPLLRIINTNTTNKLFGDLVYKKSLSAYKENYCINDFESSIYLTERGGFN